MLATMMVTQVISEVLSLAHRALSTGDSQDNNLYAEVGLQFNLGKSTWNKTPDVDAINALHQSELDALNAKLNDANAENDRLKNLLLTRSQ